MNINKKFSKKRKKIKNKNNTHTKKQKGGALVPVGEMFTKDPIWPLGVGRCTTLVTSELTPNLFGSQILSTNTFECIRTLAFYMYAKDIKRIISLQGCPVPYPGRVVPPNNCVGGLPLMPLTDSIHEERAWMGLKNMTATTNEDNNIVYVNCQITDMTAGTVIAWNVLNSINFNDPNQRTLVHCYAGLGRTGSVFLYEFFKANFLSNIPALQKNWLGCLNSEIMYDTLRLMFHNSIRMDNHVSNGVVVNALINQFNIDEMRDEVFHINTVTNVNILISRINYILIYTALPFLLNQDIILYKLHPIGGPVPNKMNLFIPRLGLLTQVNLQANLARFGLS